MTENNYTLYPIPYTLTIGWLYPELMSTYGDRGNIITLQKRLEWRTIGCEVLRLDVGFREEDLAKCDLLFMGGGEDQKQTIVAKDLEKKRTVLTQHIEGGTPGLYICGAYQFLGKYYREADGTVVQGLNIFDVHTESPGNKYPRLIGNSLVKLNSSVILERSDRISTDLVGFENHGGRTYLGPTIAPLATVIKGFGNNGLDQKEGAMYKNSFGTYLHGPILPKNPGFADYLLTLALEKKYGEKIALTPLDDTLEVEAHDTMAKKIRK